MKNRNRFEKLLRGCLDLTLSMTELLELEEILDHSRNARRVFQQRARRRFQDWKTVARAGTGFFSARATG